jgi:hypothetical protein
MRFNERSRSAPEQVMIIGNQKLDRAHFLTLLPAGIHGVSFTSSGVLSNKRNEEPLQFSLYFLSG